MSRHFIELLEDLKARLARMGAMVQQIVEQSVGAVLNLDSELARRAIDADALIDEEEVRIERTAIDLLALHQPTAGDLRVVTAVIKVNSDLERIADCAVNAAQRVPPLAREGRYEPPADLRLMSDTVVSNLRDAIKAFNSNDVELARRVLRNDDVVDALYYQILQDMLGQLGTDGPEANVALSNITIAKNLERVADHCTNVAEDVIFVQSGRIVRHLHQF